MNLHLQNKVYIVTGGASGIGEAICRLIASEGGIAVIMDRNGDKANALAKEIIEQKRPALPLALELTDEDNCRHAINTVIKQFNRIDGLVNNAGTNDNVSIETGTVQS